MEISHVKSKIDFSGAIHRQETHQETDSDNQRNYLNSVVNYDERINWDKYFISICLLAAKRSSCDRLHVGCLIVQDKRIVSTGYNGFLKGAPHVSRIVNGHEQFTIHAEQNAICDAANRGVSLKDSTAYITHFPCLNCFKLLISSGVREIKYLLDYRNNNLCKEMACENNIRLLKL